MNDKAGRLVQHHDLIVLVDDVEGDRLGPERAAFRRRHQHDLETLTGAHLARGSRDGSRIEPDMTLGNQRLQMAARELGRQGDERAIETQAVQRRADGRFAALDVPVPGLGRALGFIGRSVVERAVCRGGNHIIVGLFS